MLFLHLFDYLVVFWSQLKINLCVCNKHKNLDKTYTLIQIWQFRSCNLYFTCNCLPWRLVQNMIYLSAEFDLNFFWCVQPQCIQYIKRVYSYVVYGVFSVGDCHSQEISPQWSLRQCQMVPSRGYQRQDLLCVSSESHWVQLIPKKTMRVLITNRPRIQKLKFKIRNNSVIKILSSNHRG